MATQTKPGTSVHTRSRRKLNFGESQRFKGKTFFLDLCGYRRSKEMEEELTLRGATVEKFLDKSVRYIVTNRSKDDIRRVNHLRTTPSGQSPQTPSTGGLSQLMSPFSNQSSSSSDKKTAKPPYYTRAQKILQMSLDKKQGSSGTSDVLALAVNWNCKILHIDEVERELKKLKPVAVSKGDGIKKVIDLGSVRKLRSPFLKVEDSSHQYCPIIYEPSVWPTPNHNCSPRNCPFDPPRPEGLHVPHDGKETKHRKDVDKRSGYCEPCSVRFDDLEMHLKSAKHMEYANNPKNFERLDKLISQCTNFHDFITDLIQREATNKPNNEKSPSPLKKDGLALYPDRVSMVSLPSREGPLVIHSDYPVVLDQSPGVCTRQMKKKLVDSSPSLPQSDQKRTRTGF